jgi:hypothetical protein
MRRAIAQRTAILAPFRDDSGKGLGSGVGARVAGGWLRVEKRIPVVGVREEKLSRTTNSKIAKATEASIVEDVDAFAQARPAPLSTTLVLRPMEAARPPCDFCPRARALGRRRKGHDLTRRLDFPVSNPQCRPWKINLSSLSCIRALRKGEGYIDAGSVG